MDSYFIWFLGLVGIAVAEMFLSGLWAPFYFRYGLPVLVVQRPLVAAVDSLPDPQLLEREFSIKAMSPLVFQGFSQTEYAFREKAVSFRLFSYTPVMHGRLELVESVPELRVIGIANWFTISFLAFSVAASWMFRWLSFAAFVAVLVVGIYLLQARRFRGVCEAAERLLEKRGTG